MTALRMTLRQPRNVRREPELNAYAEAQQPTLCHIQDPVCALLRRWTKDVTAPVKEAPLSITTAAMAHNGMSQVTKCLGEPSAGHHHKR